MSMMASDTFLWHSMRAPVGIKLVKLTFIAHCMPWSAAYKLNPLFQKPFSISANLFASHFYWSLEPLLVSTKLEMISLTFQKNFLPFLDAIWLQLKNIMIFRRTALSNYNLTDRSWHQIPVLSVQRWHHGWHCHPCHCCKMPHRPRAGLLGWRFRHSAHGSGFMYLHIMDTQI